MTMHAIDFGVTDTAAVMHQRRHDFSAALGGKTPIGRKRDDQKIRFRFSQRRIKTSVRLRGRIKIVERFGRQQIRIRVEIARELLTLIAQVGLDLEVRVVAVLKRTIFE